MIANTPAPLLSHLQSFYYNNNHAKYPGSARGIPLLPCLRVPCRRSFWGGIGKRKKDGFGSLIYVQWRSWRWGFGGRVGVFGFCTGKNEMSSSTYPFLRALEPLCLKLTSNPPTLIGRPPQPTQSTSCTHASYLISRPRKIKQGHLHTPRKTPQPLLYLGTGQSNFF